MSEANARERSDPNATLLREFVGYLSADVPELHQVEVPKLGESVDRFLAARRERAEETRPVQIDD